MAQGYEEKYTVCLQDREFTLRRSQIEFDSPNYFTTCFLGDFREAKTRRIELDRDPDLFRIIISYLNGYVVLPLNEKTLPGGASLRPTLLNLRADAQFYQLDGLLKACDEELKPAPQRKDRFIVLGFDYQDINVPFSDVSAEAWHVLKRWPVKAEWQTHIAEDALGSGPLADLNQLQPSDQLNLELMGAIERLAVNSIKDYDTQRHRLIGWNQTGDFQHEEYTDYKVRIVYQDTSL